MSDWHTVTLDHISTQRKGINYKSEDYCDEDSGHPFITIKCFEKGGGYEPTGIKFYDGLSTRADHLSPSDILFSVTDLTRAGDIVGSPLRVPDYGRSKPALASMDCMRVDPIIDRCDKNYLYHRLMLSDVRQQMVAYSAGSTVLHLDTKKVPSIRVRIPVDVNTQAAIAEILDTIDQTIEKTEALIEKYQQIKAGLMHDLFTRGLGADGKLRPPREQAPELYQETPIGWIPKEWGIELISDLAVPVKGSTVIGPFGSDLVMSDYKSEGTPIIFVRDVKEDKFNWVSNVFISSHKARKLFAHRVNGGDLLATKMGLPPCVSCIYPDDMPMGVITADMIRMTVDSSKASPCWLSAAINHDRVKRQVAAITAGVTRAKVTLADFRSMKIAVPKPEEQLIANSILDKQRQLISAEENSLIKLQKQKSGLMHDLLTGTVPVTVDQPEQGHV